MIDIKGEMIPIISLSIGMIGIFRYEIWSGNEQ